MIILKNNSYNNFKIIFLDKAPKARTTPKFSSAQSEKRTL